MVRMRATFRLVSTVWIASAALLGNLANAQPVQIPVEPSQCSMEAWVSFAFDASVAVYGAPDETANILGYLPNDSTRTTIATVSNSR